jgi:hypothetical protein
MSKTTASTACMLALLTGLVIGQLASFASQPAALHAPGSPSSAHALVTARAFYDGLSQLLQTGGRAIASTAAPGFIEHDPNGQPDRTLPEMIDQLLATRATWPWLRVTVVSLDQSGSMVVARLSIHYGAARSIPGIPLPDVEPATVNDYLHVERAGVTDRWGANLEVPVATLALQTELSWTGASLTTPAIVHLGLEPGRKTQLPLHGPALLWVESGTVQLDRAGSDLDGTGHAAVEPIAAGEARVLQSAAPVVVRNVSSERAELWAFTVDVSAVAPATDGATAESTETTPQIAAYTPLQLSSSMSDHSPRVSITQVTLPPGASVLPHEPGIVEEIVVLDGAIELTVKNGRALFTAENAGAQPIAGTSSISTGAGVSAKGDTSFGYRVSGGRPATLLIVHVDAPTESEGEAPA